MKTGHLDLLSEFVQQQQQLSINQVCEIAPLEVLLYKCQTIQNTSIHIAVK